MQQVLADKVKLIVTDSRLAFMQGRYEESLRLAKQALDIDRKNADAHQCAGNAYMSREDIQKIFLENMIKVYSKLKNILIHCLRQVNYNGKKLVFEPFEKVGNLVFGMTRENAVEICGEIKRSRMYGYPIEDSFLDDFGDVHILCNKKGFLEAIELFPDMATETYSLFYHGTEVVLCIDIDLLVSQIRNITDDLKLDDDGEGYSSKNLGLRIYCPEDIVEDVLIHDRNYYLEE